MNERLSDQPENEPRGLGCTAVVMPCGHLPSHEAWPTWCRHCGTFDVHFESTECRPVSDAKAWWRSSPPGYNQQRVLDEKREWDARAKSLSDFIGLDPIFASIDAAEQERLKEQCEIMWQYSEILGQRIAGGGTQMEYMIVERLSKSDLEQCVNQAILDGWIPQGGVAVAGVFEAVENRRDGFTETNTVWVYSQAMIKKT